MRLHEYESTEVRRHHRQDRQATDHVDRNIALAGYKIILPVCECSERETVDDSEFLATHLMLKTGTPLPSRRTTFNVTQTWSLQPFIRPRKDAGRALRNRRRRSGRILLC